MNDTNPSPPPDEASARAGEEGPGGEEIRAAPEPVPPAPPVPEDLRISWTWTDVLIFFVFALGSMVLLEYVLQTVLLTSGRVKPAELTAYLTSSAVFVTVRQSLWFAILLVFLYFTPRPRQAAPFWQTLGWRRPNFPALPPVLRYPFLMVTGAALAIFVSSVSNFFAPARPLPIQALFQDRRSAYLIGTMAVLVAPLFEETVFRGFLYPVFARSLGIAGGIGLTGLLFGLMHAQQLWGGWAQIALLVLVGLVFTFARARTRSVIPCYFLHLGYNSILFVSLFLSREFWKLPLVR